MWIKLGHECLNLDQVLRVRFNKSFRGGQEECSAEVEALIKGELQIVTRYRGAEATALQALLTAHSGPGGGVQVLEAVGAPHGCQSLANTVHDIKVP